jgi:hypothetical protein
VRLLCRGRLLHPLFERSQQDHSPENMEKCVEKGSDTADIVRDVRFPLNQGPITKQIRFLNPQLGVHPVVQRLNPTYVVVGLPIFDRGGKLEHIYRGGRGKSGGRKGSHSNNIKEHHREQ